VASEPSTGSVDFNMQVGSMAETINVAQLSNRARDEVMRREALRAMQEREQRAQEPSANVQSLQRRAAGVLPVRIEVPRAGSSHRFVKPLVIDEETMVSFRYRQR
jgi:hypothetical protein